MADLSEIVGITLMIIGGILVLSGVILCYTTKGEYYNQDEVQAMVAAEVLEEEKRKKAEAEAAEQAVRDELNETDKGADADADADADASCGDLEEGPPAPAVRAKKSKRRGPLIAA